MYLKVVGLQLSTFPMYLALHSGCDGGDDAGLGFASEGVPQKPCELGVTVRDVARVLYQRGDDSTQGQQALEMEE